MTRLQLLSIVGCVVALALCESCRPDLFTYYEARPGHPSGFDCHVVTPVGSVQPSGDSILIQGGGIFTARKREQTFTADTFWVDVLRGGAVTIRMRTTDLEDSVRKGIALTLGKDASFIDAEGEPRREIHARLGNRPTQVVMFNESVVAQIAIGCDTVYTAHTRIPCTDVISFESVDSSMVSVRGLTGNPLRK